MKTMNLFPLRLLMSDIRTMRQNKQKLKNVFHKLRLENRNRITHININSIRDKFDCLAKNEVDIFMISETNFNSSFPQTQFCMNSFSDFAESTATTKKAAFYFT